MKKILIVCLLVLVVFSQGVSYAKSMAVILDEKKAELNNTTWTVGVKPMGTKGVAETDVITLSDGTFSSRNMANAGYAPTAFTMRVKPDETAMCETMQRNDAGEVCFWRIDIKDNEVRGVMTKIGTDGRSTDFSVSNKQ